MAPTIQPRGERVILRWLRCICLSHRRSCTPREVHRGARPPLLRRERCSDKAFFPHLPSRWPQSPGRALNLGGFRTHVRSAAIKPRKPASSLLPVPSSLSALHLSCIPVWTSATPLCSALQGGVDLPPPPSLPLSTGIYVSLSTYSTFEPSLPAPTPIPLLLPLLVTLILLVLPLPPPPSSVSSLLHPLSLPYEYELVAAPP